MRPCNRDEILESFTGHLNKFQNGLGLLHERSKEIFHDLQKYWIRCEGFNENLPDYLEFYFGDLFQDRVRLRIFKDHLCVKGIWIQERNFPFNKKSFALAMVVTEINGEIASELLIQVAEDSDIKISPIKVLDWSYTEQKDVLDWCVKRYLRGLFGNKFPYGPDGISVPSKPKVLIDSEV